VHLQRTRGQLWDSLVSCTVVTVIRTRAADLSLFSRRSSYGHGNKTAHEREPNAGLGKAADHGFSAALDSKKRSSTACHFEEALSMTRSRYKVYPLLTRRRAYMRDDQMVPIDEKLMVSIDINHVHLSRSCDSILAPFRQSPADVASAASAASQSNSAKTNGFINTSPGSAHKVRLLRWTKRQLSFQKTDWHCVGLLHPIRKTMRRARNRSANSALAWCSLSFP